MFFLTAWAMQCLYSLTGAYLAAGKPLGAGYGGVTAGQLMLGVTLLAGVTGPIISGFLLDKTFRGNAKPVMLIGYFLLCVFVYALIFRGGNGERGCAGDGFDSGRVWRHVCLPHDLLHDRQLVSAADCRGRCLDCGAASGASAACWDSTSPA